MSNCRRVRNVFLWGALLGVLCVWFGAPARAQAIAGQTLFTTQIPALRSSSDGFGLNYELGMAFTSNAMGQITSVRFWKSWWETGTHTGNLWSGDGTWLASVTFSNETPWGWQQQNLIAPVPIDANTVYVVSVNTGNTFYVTTDGGLASGVVNGNLSSVVGNNGVYGAPGTFPTNSWENSNYFRDVVFVPDSGVTSVAPSITMQPSSLSVTAGQAATFSVIAAGSGPLSYQWMNNGTAISGATSSTYTIQATTTAITGTQFQVIVSNGIGSAISNAATLTVNPAPTLLLSVNSTALSFGNVSVSTTAIQTVTLSNIGNSTVSVSNVSISGAGFDANGLPAGLILAPGQTATLNVTFTPGAAGNSMGSVTVTSTATNSPGAITLSGIGLAPIVHSASLSWTASISTVVGYNCYSSTVSGGPYTKLTTSLVTDTTYTDTTVQSGNTYYYVVTAVDPNNEESAYSTEVAATLP